jgi:isoquinoline 1-oxidoreductase beta subunit
VALRDPATFRYITKPVARLDIRDKSMGKGIYAIDQKVEGMLYAAVQHSVHFGTEPAQLEPQSSIARFNVDGTLEVWVPNQIPELFQVMAERTAGHQQDQVTFHSPMLGGFFGRHFMYGPSNPFPQAILLAKATGRLVKVLWSREEEFLNDALRSLSHSPFRAALDSQGNPTAIEVRTVGKGPIGRWFGAIVKSPLDSSAVEGIVEKPYVIANRKMELAKVAHPVTIAFWRSVGYSGNNFFYEGFFDEIADAGGKDPFALRLALLKDKPRHKALLEAVADPITCRRCMSA